MRFFIAQKIVFHASICSDHFELKTCVSRITVSCAAMASFQPNGHLYDTRGIIPDVTVERTPRYYINDGEDVILQKAIKFLLGN